MRGSCNSLVFYSCRGGQTHLLCFGRAGQNSLGFSVVNNTDFVSHEWSQLACFQRWGSSLTWFTSDSRNDIGLMLRVVSQLTWVCCLEQNRVRFIVELDSLRFYRCDTNRRGFCVGSTNFTYCSFVVFPIALRDVWNSTFFGGKTL